MPITEARQGCCSHHSGVCGNRCCDGTPLSAKCGGGGGSAYYYYVPTCPSNSHSIGAGKCECNLGYKPDGFSCVRDYQYHCSVKYPGTVYESSTNMCECPGEKPLGRNPQKKRCPVTNSNCQMKYGIGAQATGFNECFCKDGYILSGFDVNNATCIPQASVYKSDTNESSKENELIPFIGGAFIIYIIIIFGFTRK